MKALASPLVGKWFHSFTEDDKVAWQGMVEGDLGGGYYLVMLLEWVAGGYSCHKVVAVESMASWQFYPDIESMNHEYKYSLGPRMDRMMKKEAS